MWKDLKTQFNVIKALTIHNLQGQMSGYKYGFAWLILEPLLFIAGFRLMKKFLGGLASPPGMTPLMFYVLGVFPIFMALFGLKSYSIPVRPSKLLTFPRVTPFDLVIASNLSMFAIYFVLFWLMVVPISIYENVWPPQDVMEVMLSLITAWIMGWSLGLVISAPFRSFPPLKQFVGYANFALRMSSGLFFCITMLPLAFWPYVTWNPLFHVTELVRDAWFEGY